ncbi:MAG: hypothetical protein HOC91_06295 [Nitrospinaceae bacterium]|nr:hypothetical protein [Nitrospinaceae bacterium]MBT3434697.1 hypothetical protein [Nitrospinaceae bacterium]MBT3822981.1 hypothetical protein [Nitrospinaceae bacterium]MBT4095183.1 hypothetical protein [Nitrospinaceae bacterium]MBT4430107.1 hypothetical protein [Nitrospinaceae bacterium]
MYLDFALLGLVVVSFSVAFYFVKWGGDSNTHVDSSDSWRFTDLGGGGV